MVFRSPQRRSNLTEPQPSTYKLTHETVRTAAVCAHNDAVRVMRALGRVAVDPRDAGEAAITGGVTAMFVNGRGQPHGFSLGRTGGKDLPVQILSREEKKTYRLCTRHAGGK